MQIKITMRYHFTPVRRVITKRQEIAKTGKGSGEKGALIHFCCDCKVVQLVKKTLWRFLKN